MTELEKLRQQKKEIEARIRELSNKTVTSGIVRIGVEHYPTLKPDRWYLGIGVQNIGYPSYSPHASSFRTVINAKNREDIIKEIPNLITDLQNLYYEVRGHEDR